MKKPPKNVDVVSDAKRKDNSAAKRPVKPVKIYGGKIDSEARAQRRPSLDDAQRAGIRRNDVAAHHVRHNSQMASNSHNNRWWDRLGINSTAIKSLDLRWNRKCDICGIKALSEAFTMSGLELIHATRHLPVKRSTTSASFAVRKASIIGRLFGHILKSGTPSLQIEKPLASLAS
ncbi:hypothetical protein B0H14DRAFT_2645248 [Mycena olivaceomarginata]|nr:hypothetical protein B0H14DRAFT_2645248 [Mycena olivaceomarginata]